MYTLPVITIMVLCMETVPVYCYTFCIFRPHSANNDLHYALPTTVQSLTRLHGTGSAWSRCQIE